MNSHDSSPRLGEATPPSFQINAEGSAIVIKASGQWRIRSLGALQLGPLSHRSEHSQVCVDGSDVTELDTAGAMIIFEIAKQLGVVPNDLKTRHLEARCSNVMELLRTRLASPPTSAGQETFSHLERIGKSTLELLAKAGRFVEFLGETALAIGRIFVQPKVLRLKEWVIQLEHTGVNAVPIIVLVTFLIGTVVAYLFAGQSAKFGATIFVVEAVSMGMCRELSPIIAAILVAGRSGSAFTAQIGTMKMNQEIDAISILGLSPMHVLVVPRVLALMITLPVLVLVGDVAGILGGLTIANVSLDISPVIFLERLRQTLALRHIWIGLVKAPFFAVIIGLVGCYEGLVVEKNARSVGIHTTSTVVQSIVLVILMNAAFALVFQALEL